MVESAREAGLVERAEGDVHASQDRVEHAEASGPEGPRGLRHAAVEGRDGAVGVAWVRGRAGRSHRH